MDNVETWKVVLGGIVSFVLVLVGRASKTWKNVRKDDAEGDLYSFLSGALESSEKRRMEEAERFERRESEHERRHFENQERIAQLREEVAGLKAAVIGMERYQAELLQAMARTEEQNRLMLSELSEYRQLAFMRAAEAGAKIGA